MPDTALQNIAHKMPKMGSRVHATFDFAIAGAFLAAGAIFFSRNNKRAALGAALCGTATLAVSVLTDYQGQGKKHISYPSHSNVHTGLAAMAATMPTLLDFADENEARFFRAAAAAGSFMGIATDYEGKKKKKLPENE